MMSQTSRAGGLFYFERERGVTLVLIFLCAYVLYRRKKHQRNKIRLRSHRIPSIPKRAWRYDAQSTSLSSFSVPFPF